MAADDFAKMSSVSFGLEETVNKKLFVHGPETVLLHEVVRNFDKRILRDPFRERWGSGGDFSDYSCVGSAKKSRRIVVYNYTFFYKPTFFCPSPAIIEHIAHE